MPASASRRSSRSKTSAQDSRSQPRTSRFAAPASCWARNRAARSRRSASASISSCSSARCRRCARDASRTSTSHSPQAAKWTCNCLRCCPRTTSRTCICGCSSTSEWRVLPIPTGSMTCEAELIDRFGPLPPPSRTLLVVHRLRQRAAAIGIRRFELGAAAGVVEFSREHRVEPERVVRLVKLQGGRYRLDGQNRLRLRIATADATVADCSGARSSG